MKFLDCLAKATAEDLADIRAQAAELEAQAQALSGLAALIAKRLENGGGQPPAEPSMNGHAKPTKPRKAPAPEANGGRLSATATRDAIARVLMKGPAKSAALIEASGVANNSFYKAVKGAWFRQNEDRTWELTPGGRAAAQVALC